MLPDPPVLELDNVPEQGVPSHKLAVDDAETLKTGGSVMVISINCSHPLSSTTSTVYVPAARPDKELTPLLLLSV